MRSTRPTTALALLSVLLASACGRTIEEGRYRFETVVVRQETCTDAEVVAVDLPEGRLATFGDRVELSFPDEEPEVPGLSGTTGSRTMVGRFFPDGEEERFIADTTFDVVRRMQGVTCLVFSHASLRALVRSETSFGGSLRIVYSRRPEAQAGCPPGCLLFLDYEAFRIGD